MRIKILIYFLIFSNVIWSQSKSYFPFKIGSENFSIGSYMYKSRTQLSTINIDQKYSIINDSIIFTFNNKNRKIYISTDYGVEFNPTNYSDFFGSSSNTFYIEKLVKENDKVFIVMFSDNEIELTNKVFVYDTKKPDSKGKYLFSSLAQNNQIVTLKLSFNNILIGNSNDNIYQWKNNNWEIINIPVQNYVIESYVSGDYFYAFFSDKIRGKNNLNNLCYRTKDLNNWEKIENFTFKYGQFLLSTIFENKIFFNKKFIFDLNSKQLIKDNFITQKFSDSIHNYDFNINVCNDKLYICDTHEFPSVKLFEYKNNELNEILTLNTDCRAYKFYYSNKFGIFGDNGIFFFDNNLISQKSKKLIQKKELNISNPSISDKVQSTRNIDLSNIPVNQLNKEQCFEILDKMVKKLNGKQLTAKNFIQYQASFTSNGIGLITDEPIGQAKGQKWIITRQINWDALESIKANKINFKHSCICLKFPEGFQAYCQVVVLEGLKCKYNGETNNGGMDNDYISRRCGEQLKNKMLSNPDPTILYENEIDDIYKKIYRPFNSQSLISIIVNNEDADKFVEVIKRISIIEREKSRNTKLNLISKEKWYDDILAKWFEDSNGVMQGRYEQFDSSGKLVTFGEYKNNVKVGKWVFKGVVKIFPLFSDNCSCNRNW